jgi:predicted RNase H-like nuclease
MNSFIDSIQKKKEKLVNKIKHSHTSFSVNTVSKSKEDLYKNIIEGLRENIQILVKSSNSTNITTTFNYKSKSLEYSSSSALSFEMHRSYIRITDTNNILVVDLPIVRSNYEALQPLSILLKSIKIS